MASLRKSTTTVKSGSKGISTLKEDEKGEESSMESDCSDDEQEKPEAPAKLTVKPEVSEKPTLKPKAPEKPSTEFKHSTTLKAVHEKTSITPGKTSGLQTAARTKTPVKTAAKVTSTRP